VTTWDAFTHRTDLYARRVLGDAAAGEPIVAGPYVRLACQRHLRDRELAAAAAACGHPKGFWFNEVAADHIINFFEQVLRLPDTRDDAGQALPFLLAPAQDFILGCCFGWTKIDGYRRFVTAYIEMGKGNGKTPLIAGIGLYGLVMDNEYAAQIFCAATSEDQALLLWNDAKNIVEASPELASILKVREAKGAHNISYPELKSFFRPFTKEQAKKSGTRPHMGLIDELHEDASGDAPKKVRAGTKGRKQPLIFEITNSGFDRTTICWQHREHSRRLLERAVDDDAWFAYVCALDGTYGEEGADDPLTDKTCWVKANPLLGVSIREDYLQRQVETAINIPAETNTVLRLNFCVWTQAISRFFDLLKWAGCSAYVSDQDLKTPGVVCYAALDAGQTDDFTSLVGLFLLPDGRKAVRCKFWLPQAALEKYPERPYDQWKKAELLTITEGDVIDYDVVEEDVYQACRTWGAKELAYDKRFVEQLAQHLVGKGIDCTDQPQGFYLNEGLGFVRDAVQSAQLCHGDHAVLTWMASNMVVRHGPNKMIRPDKDAAKDKIDGIVALVMAAQRASVAPKPAQTVYATRGAYVIGRAGSLTRQPVDRAAAESPKE